MTPIRNQQVSITEDCLLTPPDESAISLVNCHGHIGSAERPVVVDYAFDERGPFTQGTIKQLSTQWLHVLIDAGYPFPTKDWVNAKLIPFRDGKMLPCVFAKGSTFIKHGPTNTVDVECPERFIGGLKVGDRIAIPNRTQPHAAVLKGCRDMTINLQVHSSPNLALCLLDCENIILNLVVKPKRGRLISSCGDGLMLINCRWIRANVNISGTADDGFNVHGYLSKPAPGFNHAITITGRVADTFGGAKVSGTAIWLSDFRMRDTQGPLCVGSEDNPTAGFDSGPLCEDNQVTLSNVRLTNVGIGKQGWPAQVYGKGEAFVAANLTRKDGKTTGLPVAVIGKPKVARV